MKKRLNVIMFLCSLLSTPVLAQSQDTVRHQTILQELEISTDKAPSQTQSASPVQVITLEKIERSGADNVADVLSLMAGVTIKDYGGVGGIKTVSVRGLGSQFSTLTIDGVAVSDFQNGQIDLGRYLVGNSSFIGLAQGQMDNIFQTARSFSAGSVINMESTTPTSNFGLHTSIEGGSFGYVAPSLQIEKRIAKGLWLQMWGNYTKSNGDYPFTIYYTQSQTDSSSREIRKNSEMEMVTIDANLHYAIKDGHQLNAKIHYNQAFHNLPGPATYYYIKASEHTEDNSLLAQVRYSFTGSEKWKIQAIGKYYSSDCIYEDTAANGSSGLIHNEYHQQEYYASATAQYSFGPYLRASFATDESLNNLQSNLNHDNDVRRISSLNVLALSYRRSRLSSSANMIATLLRDLDPDGAEKSHYYRLSPYAAASVLALNRQDSLDTHADKLRFRAFVKENYRIPTFNELYYFTLQRDLLPEKALQSNLGLTYYGYRQIGASSDLDITATADAYYNRVSDKLVAIPTQNLFLWSMINLSRVDIWGLDINTEASWSRGRHEVDLSFNYSFQKAEDVTDPTDKTYRQQIPYTPVHSGGATLYWKNPWANVGYSLQAVGDRYRLGQNTEANLVPGYVDQGITINHSFSLKHGSIDLQGQVLNLFDVQYEVVKSYPMMGRNYRLKLTYSI